MMLYLPIQIKFPHKINSYPRTKSNLNLMYNGFTHRGSVGLLDVLELALFLFFNFILKHNLDTNNKINSSIK